MKRNNLLKVLSLAVLLGGLAKVVTNETNTNNLFIESTEATAEFGDGQKSVKLREPRRANGETDLLASAVKVQISNIDENGNRSIRYIAAISSLEVDATFVRTIYNEDGSVFATQNIMPVEYAYDALIADGEIVLPSSFGEEYKYFIAYTLGNVPENYWYNRIDVSVAVNEEVSERQANIEGVNQGYIQDENLVYTERAKYPGQYQVAAASTDITSANISDYHVVYEDIVATRGKVTAIAKRGFEGCNNLEKLVIPNTISYFDEMCFDGVTYIEEVQYNATSASAYNNVTMPNVGTIKFGEDVSAFPDGMFLSNSIDNIEFAGSTDEWNSIDKGENNFTLEEVKCEDSAVYTIVFHFNGATLNGKENSYSYETYEGKTLINPGKPEKEGETFAGWYLDENYETEFATVPASFPKGTEVVNVYAKFIAQEGGIDAEHPLPLNSGLNEEKTTSISMPHVYYSFTPDKTDNYTFQDVSTSATKFSTSGIWLYAADMTLLSKDTSSGQFELTWKLEAGQNYIIRAGHYSETPTLYGTIQINITTVDGDQISEAQEINFNEDVANTYLGSSKPFYYEYTPNGTSNPTSVRIKNTNTTTGIIYINLLNKATKEVVDLAKFAKYGTSTAQYKDFSLVSGVTYIFEIYTPTKNKAFTFKLIEAPQGATLDNPYTYTLGNGQVSIPYSTLNNCYEDFEASKKYYDAYYKFVPTESFNGKLTIGNDMSTSTSKRNAKSIVEVYKDGVSIYKDGTASDPVQNPSVDLDFVAGSVYIINVKSIGSSLVKPYATTLSITANSVVTPGEGETEEPAGGESLDNPLVIEESITVPSSTTKFTVEAGKTTYFQVSITKAFTDLIVDAGFEVKLYSSKGILLDDDSSAANKVLNYNAFGEGTYFIALTSTNGGTTTLELQDNYDLYNEY